jgi:type II restriction enzyme
MRDFNTWLGKMRPSINNYGYYVDFQKVYDNVDSIKVELNIMNSLIGSADIENEFRTLLVKYPEILKCIPTLLAVRQSEIYAQDEDGAFLYDFNKLNYSVEQYIVFMKKTGLLDLIANHLVNNLVDYALGIETGLDSNGRKNRGGHQMENLVESFIQLLSEMWQETYNKDR